MFDDLREAIAARRTRAGVIGLGYVGLPLLAELAEAGFDAVGLDVDRGRVEAIGRGESYVADVPGEALRALAAAGRLRATADFGVLADLDTIGICVPTPLHKTKDPDLSHVEAAVGEVARRLRPGQLVVLESTTWPGTVEEFRAAPARGRRPADLVERAPLVVDTRNALAGVDAAHVFRL